MANVTQEWEIPVAQDDIDIAIRVDDVHLAEDVAVSCTRKDVVSDSGHGSRGVAGDILVEISLPLNVQGIAR